MAFNKARALQLADQSVAQGKMANAIKQYQEILDKDPSDLSLLNTLGDLYVRNRNITEGLRQFHRLAEAYVREGYNVKAIAIYRKISKVDSNSIDTFLRLGELYQLQGLNRESREQYLQAAEFFKNRRQIDRLLEVFRKLVQLDPENINFRNRLSAECELAGKREVAALGYSETAEILLRRNDREAAEVALNKATALDPGNSHTQILLARVEIMLGKYAEAERIINSSAGLQGDAVGKRILLDAYLGSQKLDEALNLAIVVFRASPADFAAIDSVCAALVKNARVDEAYRLLESMAEPLLVHGHAGQLLDALRRVWRAAPQNIPTMELIQRVCERTANEGTLSEILEALGPAYEMAGDLDKAEVAYLQLRQREPGNEMHRALLNEVQQKLGRASNTGTSPSEPVKVAAREAREGGTRQPASADARQEMKVKEALENSDLFVHYNLPEKAITELERVLQVFPDQIEIHRRILEITRKGSPEKALAAAAQLARIFTEHGDTETAGKYYEIARAEGPLDQIPLPGLPKDERVEEPTKPSSASGQMPEVERTTAPPVPAAPPEDSAAEEAAQPFEIPLDLTPIDVSSEPLAAAPLLPAWTEELDLSGELESLAAVDVRSGAEPTSKAEPAASTTDSPTETDVPAEALTSREMENPALAGDPVPVPSPDAAMPPGPGDEVISRELEDGKVEVEFYLENDFVDEARQTVVALEQKYPASPFVSALRQQLELADRAAHTASEGEDNGLLSGRAETAEPEIVLLPEPELTSEELAPDDWEIPSMFAPSPAPEPTTISTGPSAETVAPESIFSAGGNSPVIARISPPAGAGLPIEEPVGSAAGPSATIGDLAADLPGAVPPSTGPEDAAKLGSLLKELVEGDEKAPGKDHPDAHYNLGVAFREMGLLDESIGEFQKVVMGSGNGNFPANFLAACSLLAICFVDKKMPAIAARWYLRALETPNLDEEASLALQYDLGVAYQLAGDSRKALERYTNVYSQNIDFRDVAEKVRELQQKA